MVPDLSAPHTRDPPTAFRQRNPGQPLAPRSPCIVIADVRIWLRVVGAEAALTAMSQSERRIIVIIGPSASYNTPPDATRVALRSRALRFRAELIRLLTRRVKVAARACPFAMIL